MEFMADKPDNFYDLAIVDPPYGIADKVIKGGEANRKKELKLSKNLDVWDNIPSDEYFIELFRISKNSIIWGGNYFVKNIFHSRGWIVWDKIIGQGMNFAKAELAFTSFNKNMEIIKMDNYGKPKRGLTDKNAEPSDKKIHPTQKPVDLYKYCLSYAEPNDKILDTHGGSMSIAIACSDMGFDLDLCELDKDYFEAGKKRYQKHISQIRMF